MYSFSSVSNLMFRFCGLLFLLLPRLHFCSCASEGFAGQRGFGFLNSRDFESLSEKPTKS